MPAEFCRQSYHDKKKKDWYNIHVIPQLKKTSSLSTKPMINFQAISAKETFLPNSWASITSGALWAVSATHHLNSCTRRRPNLYFLGASEYKTRSASKCGWRPEKELCLWTKCLRHDIAFGKLRQKSIFQKELGCAHSLYIVWYWITLLWFRN